MPCEYDTFAIVLLSLKKKLKQCKQLWQVSQSNSYGRFMALIIVTIGMTLWFYNWKKKVPLLGRYSGRFVGLKHS